MIIWWSERILHGYSIDYGREQRNVAKTWYSSAKALSVLVGCTWPSTSVEKPVEKKKKVKKIICETSSDEDSEETEIIVKRVNKK